MNDPRRRSFASRVLFTLGAALVAARAWTLLRRWRARPTPGSADPHAAGPTAHRTRDATAASLPAPAAPARRARVGALVVLVAFGTVGAAAATAAALAHALSIGLPPAAGPATAARSTPAGKALAVSPHSSTPDAVARSLTHAGGRVTSAAEASATNAPSTGAGAPVTEAPATRGTSRAAPRSTRPGQWMQVGTGVLAAASGSEVVPPGQARKRHTTSSSSTTSTTTSSTTSTTTSTASSTTPSTTSTASSTTSSTTSATTTSTTPSTSTTSSSTSSSPAWSYGFEDGSTDGWSVDYGPATVSNSATVAYSGSHSLAVTLTGAGNPGIMSPAAPAGVTTGTALTYHVFEPAGLALSAVPYTTDGDWTYAFASPVVLNEGAWTTLTFTVPPLQNGLRYFGIEIENGDGAAGTVYLDAIGWPGAGTSSTSSSSSASSTTSSSTTTATATVAGTGTPQPNGDPGSWRLVFDDEFAGTALDPLYWSTGWFGSGITGTVGGASENDCYDPAQVVEGNGELDLNIVARTETCDGTTKAYATGFVTTDGLFSYSYGFVEARMWLPGSGAIADWPSFWQDGQSWPTDGELDVVEGLGGHACAHWHGPSGNGQGFAPGGGTGCPSGTFTGGWHTFGADWEPGIVTWYYDGRDIGCVASSGSGCGPTNSTITAAPMYLILGLGAGSSTIAPATQRVDYVRVWQH